MPVASFEDRLGERWRPHPLLDHAARKPIAHLKVNTPTKVNNSPQVYLTRCIDSTVIESQLPHKIVDLLFRLVKVNNKLTICGRVEFLKSFNRYMV